MGDRPPARRGRPRSGPGGRRAPTADSFRRPAPGGGRSIPRSVQAEQKRLLGAALSLPRPVKPPATLADRLPTSAPARRRRPVRTDRPAEWRSRCWRWSRRFRRKSLPKRCDWASRTSVRTGSGSPGIVGGRRDAARWHLIGHLQRNRPAKVPGLFDVVHSVDDAESAAAPRAVRARAPVLIEVNVSGEASKFGDAAGRAERAVSAGRVARGSWSCGADDGAGSGGPADDGPFARPTGSCATRSGLRLGTAARSCRWA